MKILSTLIVILALSIGGLQAQSSGKVEVNEAIPVETKANAASLPDATMESTGTDAVKAKSCHGSSTEGKKSCCAGKTEGTKSCSGSAKATTGGSCCAGKTEGTKASGCSHGHGSTSSSATIPDAKQVTEVEPRDDE